MKKRLKTVPDGPVPVLDPETVPGYVKTNVAQVVFEAVLADFRRPEIREDYRRWKAARETEKAKEAGTA